MQSSFININDRNAQRNSAGSLTRPCQQIYHFLALTVEK